MPRRKRRSWAGSFSDAGACFAELKDRLYLAVGLALIELRGLKPAAQVLIGQGGGSGGGSSVASKNVG